jgi:hypothetical protein
MPKLKTSFKKKKGGKSESIMTQVFPSTSSDAQLLQINNTLFQENTARSNNEQQLYSAWQKSEMEKQQMQDINRSLQEQIKVMQLELQQLKLNLNTRETIPQEHEIKDDDLHADTQWVRVENSKKKRKLEETKTPKQTIQNASQARTASTHTQPKQTHKPPPIMITGVISHEEMTSFMNHAIGEENYQTKLLNNGVNKINVSSEHAYRVLTQTLKDNKILWHTYENKNDRDIRVMIKNLHHSFQPASILRSLSDQGLKALNATPKLKWKTKEPLDMFIVSFQRDTDIRKIYNIQTICRAAVIVEPLRSNKLIPQCKICQSFGHTKNYCNKAPRCVKCAGPHLTIECTKPNSAQPKCCHCGKSHPANYRGCEVIKELQKLRDNKNNKNKLKQQAKNKPVRVDTTTEPRNLQNTRKTYSQVVSHSSTEPSQSTRTDSMLVQIMQMLKEQDLRLNKIESRLKIANH